MGKLHTCGSIANICFYFETMSCINWHNCIKITNNKIIVNNKINNCKTRIIMK